MHEFLGAARGPHDGVVVAVQFDAEAHDRLAGGGDAVDHALGPAFLDADHHHRRHVRVAAGADEGAEVQFQVFAELQAAVGVRQGQRALDVVGDGLGRRIEMSSTGSTMTWLRTPTRPLSRR